MGRRKLTLPPEIPTTDVIDYGLWVRSGAIVLSFIGVIVTIVWNQSIARKRATLDIVLNEESDPNQLALRTDFVKMRDAGNLSKYADPKHGKENETNALRGILNRYELVAIGIRKGIIHERSYKDWCRRTYVQDWIECKGFVTQLRKNRGSSVYFCEFEKLAKKWATKEEKELV